MSFARATAPLKMCQSNPPTPTPPLLSSDDAAVFHEKHSIVGKEQNVQQVSCRFIKQKVETDPHVCVAVTDTHVCVAITDTHTCDVLKDTHVCVAATVTHVCCMAVEMNL